MTQTQRVKFGGRFFWAYDASLHIFLKYLIDAAEASEHANEEWLVDAVSQWRVQASIIEFGLTLEDHWSEAQRNVFIKLAEEACTKLATRESIPVDEITKWRLHEDLRIFPRAAKEVFTAPIIELGRAIIAVVSGTLPVAPENEAWFYGTPNGRTTIRMMDGTW